MNLYNYISTAKILLKWKFVMSSALFLPLLLIYYLHIYTWTVVCSLTRLYGYLTEKRYKTQHHKTDFHINYAKYNIFDILTSYIKKTHKTPKRC